MGDFLFLPYTGPGENKIVGILNHENEMAEVGYYSILLEPWKIFCELTSTERVGWHRYSYPPSEKAKLMIDLSHVLQPNWGHNLLESELTFVNEYSVKGYRKTSGWAKEDPVWFTAKFDQPIVSKQIIDGEKTINSEKVKGKKPDRLSRLWAIICSTER